MRHSLLSPEFVNYLLLIIEDYGPPSEVEWAKPISDALGPMVKSVKPIEYEKGAYSTRRLNARSRDGL